MQLPGREYNPNIALNFILMESVATPGGTADLTFSVGPTQVPEPSTLLVMGAGLAMLMGFRRKRRASDRWRDKR